MKIFLSLFLFAVATQARGIGTRVIGGQEARAGQFPSAAAINVRTSNSIKFCSGALVSAQWILTSAYCASDAVSFEIQLGSTKLIGNDANRVTVSTNDFVLHPEYDPVTLNNDLALIKLRLPVEFTTYVQSIRLSIVSLLNDTELQTFGWGQVNDNDPEFSNDLNYVDLAVVSNEECKLIYGNQITDNMVCLEGNYNEGLCNGDSGAPLIEVIGRIEWLVGIGSFFSGNGCESTEPSGFTRIYPYLDWIKSTTGIEN